MTTLQPAPQSDHNRQFPGVERRRVLPLTAMVWVAMALLDAQGTLSPAGAADDSQAPASASPSDLAPAEAQPSPATEAQSPAFDAPLVCSCRRMEAVCCRPGRPLIGLLRSRLSRRCCRCVCGSQCPDPYAWREMFDGRTLDGWEVPDFGGRGEVYVEDGQIVIATELGMLGVTWTGELPRENFELEYEGARLAGYDFFATVTFPVGEDECSLVTGGWGGTVVGLSTIDFCDASENRTTSFREFEDGRWYRFRVRVTESRIEAWIDAVQVVDQWRGDHEIGIRGECEPNRPLGFATYYTQGALRNIRIRNLKPAEQNGDRRPPPDEENPFGL